MEIRAVLYTLEAGIKKAECNFLDSSTLDAMDATSPKIAPSLYVVAEKHLDYLKKLPQIIIDRGEKHPKKPLASYYLGHK